MRTGAIDPSALITQKEPMTAVLDAYEAFDVRQSGWLKVVLHP